MRRTQIAMVVAAASLGIAISPRGDDIVRDDSPKPGPKPITQPRSVDSAAINRRTGKPHEGTREAARRLRQMASKATA